MKTEKKEKKTEFHRKRRILELLEKAGIFIPPSKVNEIVFNMGIIINMIITGYMIFYFSVKGGFPLSYIFVATMMLWTLAFLGLVLVLWLVLYVIIDLKIYQRKVGIEEVFPDFLQLTSANIRAGMPIDQALWHAIRPNFGVLAKEMGDVAKKSMSGTSLEKALYEFASKYESTTLKRSVSLLIEGLNAGGEIGELLDRIATNLQEARIMQKEMAASVTTYVIFISFASIAAAPFLLALSNQLLFVIGQIISSIDIPSGSGAFITFEKVSVQPGDFKIFAITTLTISSAISAMIIAVIKKGNIKAGLKYIPMFIASTIIIFIILDKLLGLVLAGVF